MNDSLAVCRLYRSGLGKGCVLINVWLPPNKLLDLSYPLLIFTSLTDVIDLFSSSFLLNLLVILLPSSFLLEIGGFIPLPRLGTKVYY